MEKLGSSYWKSELQEPYDRKSSCLLRLLSLRALSASRTCDLLLFYDSYRMFIGLSKLVPTLSVVHPSSTDLQQIITLTRWAMKLSDTCSRDVDFISAIIMERSRIR